MGRFEPFNWRDFDPGEHPQLMQWTAPIQRHRDVPEL
jgi:hypothetical protein